MLKSNAEGKRILEPFYVGAVKSRLKWCQIHFNENPLTSEDFEVICQAEGILLIRDNRKWDGAYFRRKDTDVIYIKSTLQGAMKTFVEFHELSHFWLHEPGFYTAECNRNCLDKGEYQASFIAACALIPKSFVESFSKAELLEMFCYQDIVEFRLQIYKDHRI